MKQACKALGARRQLQGNSDSDSEGEVTEVIQLQVFKVKDSQSGSKSTV
jgi:hypothetical protein